MENSWDRFVLLRICPAELEPDKVFCSTAVRMYKILEYNDVGSFGPSYYQYILTHFQQCRADRHPCNYK